MSEKDDDPYEGLKTLLIWFAGSVLMSTVLQSLKPDPHANMAFSHATNNVHLLCNAYRNWSHHAGETAVGMEKLCKADDAKQQQTARSSVKQ